MQRKLAVGSATTSVIAVALVCALGLGLNLYIALLNHTGWGVDFNQFYSAARLAGTGDLYNWDKLRKLELENGIEVPTGRLPVVLYSYKLLDVLPYKAARILWTVLCIGALIVFALIWPGSSALPMTIVLCWSLPATLAVLYGQDIPFWLMFFGVALRFADRKPRGSGMMFSLCICKFHLAAGVPIMLVAQKRWKTLIAGAIAMAALMGASFLIEGPGWPLAYAKMSSMPGFSPAPERMPSVYGLASWLPWTSAVEALLAAGVVALLWMTCRATTDLGVVGAASAACGLLIGHHAYAEDCALLIPLAVVTIRRRTPAWLKLLAILVLSPVSVLLLASRKPWAGQILILAFVVSAVFWVKGEARSGATSTR